MVSGPVGETHPLQAAVSALLLLSSAIILLSAYQASAESFPEVEYFKKRVVVRGTSMSLAEACVEAVRRTLKGPARALLVLSLRHAREYLSYGAFTAAAYEASRAYRFYKKLKRLWRTTS